MLAEELRYSPRNLGDEDATRLQSKWDNDLIMDWIETQPNPLEAPEFYEPMAEHDPLEITLSREIRENLHETWSLGYEFVHPLAVEFFEHNYDETVVESAQAAEDVLAALQAMGIKDATLTD